MNKLGIIIKKLMEASELNESQLAKQTGLSQSVINRLMSGTTHNPRVKTLHSIAHFFSVNISQLLGDEPLPKTIFTKSGHPLLRHWMYIPMLTWKKVPLWITDPAPSNKIIDKNTEWITTDLNVSHYAYALYVSNSSLLPLFPAHTTLIVDPMIDPCDQDYMIIKLEKNLVLRQYIVDNEGAYALSIRPPNYKIKLNSRNFESHGVMLQAHLNFLRPRNLPPLSVAMNMEKFYDCA